jgi:hypothetical protein
MPPHRKTLMAVGSVDSGDALLNLPTPRRDQSQIHPGLKTHLDLYSESVVFMSNKIKIKTTGRSMYQMYDQLQAVRDAQ